MGEMGGQLGKGPGNGPGNGPGKYKNLFEPVTICGMEIKNRYFMAPMGTFGLVDEHGALTQNGVDYYVERARGGIGLIITGICRVNTDIEQMGPVVMTLQAPFAFMGTASQVTRLSHAYGAKVFLQLSAGFGRTLWPALGRTWVAPSPVANRHEPSIQHRALTTEEVETFIKDFARAAVMAQTCGFDGVEIHALHEGYLLDQFATEIFNQRKDRYGGNFENRYRFATEIVQGIKVACGRNYPVSLRYSPKHFMKDIGVGGLEGEDFVERGRDLPEGIAAAKLLEAAGYDALNVDVGCYDSHYWNHPTVFSKDGLYVKYAAAIKEAVSIPVLVAGRLGDPDLASEVIRSGKADMIGLGRPSLADPDLPQKIQQGRAEAVRHCLNCDVGCSAELRRCWVLTCAINAQCGRERLRALRPLTIKRKIVVVGGGPGGMEAARVAARRGHHVVLFEKEDRLGGNLLPAGYADFKTADHKLIAWYENELKRHGVRLELNREFTPETMRTIDYDVLILAPGSVPFMPNIPGRDKAHVFTAVDILSDIGKAGDRIVLIGAGQVGCETAIWLAQKGKKVHLVEMLPDIMSGGAPASGLVRHHATELFHFLGIDVHLSTTVREITDTGVVVENSEGKRTITADTVIFSTGYVPANALYRKLRAEATELYLIGDGRQVSNLLGAIHEGYELANNL
jgi:2-enoate reductase